MWDTIIWCAATAITTGSVTTRICTKVYRPKIAELQRPDPPNYTCLCGHKLTAHERIEYYDGDVLMLKYGRCTVLTGGTENNRTCACTGYQGDLPVEPGSVPSVDGVPVTAIGTVRKSQKEAKEKEAKALHRSTEYL
jgi:hypothetical protein